MIETPLTPEECDMLEVVARNEMLGGATVLGERVTKQHHAAIQTLLQRKLIQSQGRNHFTGPELVRLTNSGHAVVLAGIRKGLPLISPAT